MARRQKPLEAILQNFLLEEEGFRPLTGDELEYLGFSRTSRRYTSQPRGTRKSRLRPTKTISYYEGGKRVGRGTTKQRRERTARKRAQLGGKLPTDRYHFYAREFARINEMTIAQAKKDPRFQELYRNATRKPGKTRTRAQTRARLKALFDLELILSPDYQRYDDG